MADVYISCAREDREIACHLAELLEQSGLTVFFDMEALVLGHNFSKSITDALGQARAVVVLLSANTKRSTWVQHELSSVIEQTDGPIVIPVLLDRNAKENWVWPLISNRQAIDLAERPEKLEDVATQLQKALGVGGEFHVANRLRSNSKYFNLSAAIAITLLVVVGLFLNPSNTNGEPSLFQQVMSVLNSPLVSGLLGVLVGALFTRSRK